MKRFGQNPEQGRQLKPNDRVLIMHDLEHTSDGTVVDEWPLHLTVIPPFYPKERIALASLIAIAKQELTSSGSIKAHHELTTHFGPNENIPVALLSATDESAGSEMFPTDPLGLLHRRVMLGVAALSQPIELTYAFNNYNAHVSLRDPNMKLDDFYVNDLTIGIKDGETRKKRIAAVIKRG